MNSIYLRLVAFVTTTLLLLPLGALAEEEIDEMVLALRNLEQSVANNQLEQAEAQLQSLQQRIPGDTRLEQAQRTISAGYLQQGESALKAGNLPAATQSLTKAKRILPTGNAQASALSEAIAQSQKQQEAKAFAARQAAEAQAKAAAEKAAQERQQKLAAERKAAEARKSAEVAAIPVQPMVPVAKLIDPQAPSSTVALTMLDNKDNDSLRTLLDQVAQEVLAFRCKVSIEVRQSKDYPWVAALLAARVKKLDPAFNLQLEQQINPDKDPRLVLTPQP